MGHECDTLVHRGWSEVDCVWCCEPDGQFDRDAQRNHQLLLRAREAESFCCGCLTSLTYIKEAMTVRIIHERVAGLDVHKKTVVATRMQVVEDKRLDWKTKTFGTTTPDLLTLHDWLAEWGCTHVAMESTGDYWKPVHNLLEDDFEVLLVNAQHVKHVPGRKTDVGDSVWLAELLLYGLLKPSFIPPKPQRALRDLTRYRTRLVQERTRVVNRVHKLLEGANIKVASVATNIMGVSARAMLEEIVGGQTDAKRMANLARGRMRNKIPELEKALTGFVGPHQRFLLAKQLGHIDFLDEQIDDIGAEIARWFETQSQGSGIGGSSASDESSIAEPSAPNQESPLTWAEAIDLLDTIPGVDLRMAENMLAEMGLNMAQFPTDKHLTSWAGLAPGNHQSGGKRYSGRTRKGSRTLSAIMVQGAWSAIRTKDTFLNARYHRLAARRGKKRALVAIARTMLVSAWHILTYRQPYRDLGGDYFDQRKKETKVSYLTRQLEKLTGGAVRIELQTATA
jgi:transposase